MPLGFAALSWLSGRTMMRLLAKDGAAMPAVEHATVLVLAAALVILVGPAVKLSRVKGSRMPKAWLWLWICAALYFAGEETSWGQWAFGWRTPASLAELNKQGETNIHNVSPWLNHKPQAAAEVFIAAAGWIMPLWRLVRPSRRAAQTDRFSDWVVAQPALIPAALFHSATKVCVWLPGPQRLTFGAPELQEFAVAFFMALYMVSLAGRAAALVRARSAADAVMRGH